MTVNNASAASLAARMNAVYFTAALVYLAPADELGASTPMATRAQMMARGSTCVAVARPRSIVGHAVQGEERDELRGRLLALSEAAGRAGCQFDELGLLPESEPPFLRKLPLGGAAGAAAVFWLVHSGDEPVHAAIGPGVKLFDQSEFLPPRIEEQHEDAHVVVRAAEH